MGVHGMGRLSVYSAVHYRTVNEGKSRSYFIPLHLIGPCWTLLYFPMQKVPKIKLSTSSGVVAPVISSSGRSAL